MRFWNALSRTVLLIVVIGKVIVGFKANYSRWMVLRPLTQLAQAVSAGSIVLARWTNDRTSTIGRLVNRANLASATPGARRRKPSASARPGTRRQGALERTPRFPARRWRRRARRDQDRRAGLPGTRQGSYLIALDREASSHDGFKGQKAERPVNVAPGPSKPVG